MIPHCCNVVVFVLLYLSLSLGAACSSNDMNVAEEPSDSDNYDSVTNSDSDGGEVPSFSMTERVDEVAGWRLAWARNVGGLTADVPSAVGAFQERALVTGYYNGQATFGAGEVGETTLLSMGDNMFLAAYEPDGRLAWAKSTDGIQVIGNGLDTAPDGSIVVGGMFYDVAAFGLGEPNETVFKCGQTLPEPCPTHFPNMFVSKHTPDGDLLWVRAVEVMRDDATPAGCGETSYCDAQARSVGVGADGSVIMVGFFQGMLAFDRGTGSEQVITSSYGMATPDEQDCLIAALDPEGRRLWHRIVGGAGKDACQKVHRSHDGTFFVTGYYDDEIVLGRDEANETVLTPSGEASVFLARYEDDGDLLWAQDLGIDGDPAESTGALEVLSNGDIAISGRFSGAMTVGGPGEEGSVVEVPPGGMGIFLSRYAPSGTRIWNRVALSVGGLAGSNDLAELADGHLIAVGRYSIEIAFAPMAANSIVLTSDGNPMDGWIAELTADGEFVWALSQGGSCHDTFQGVRVFPATDIASERFLVAGMSCGALRVGTGGGDEVFLFPHDLNFADIMVLSFARE